MKSTGQGRNSGKKYIEKNLQKSLHGKTFDFSCKEKIFLIK
jgi:hypothetical protein